MSYQDQVSQMHDAGFSGQEIQGWSDKQAATMLGAGFNQDEVDKYQGMTPPVTSPDERDYSKVPTDKDFHNAASVILGGNDHPFYESAVKKLQNLFSDTGTQPADAVKVSQVSPSFRQIMEQGDEPSYLSSLGSEAIRSAGTNLAEFAQSQAIRTEKYAQTQAQTTADSPIMSALSGGAPDTSITNPENTPLYQLGANLQKWIDKNYPSNQKFEQQNPITSSLASGLGQAPLFLGTGGTSWSAEGTPAYKEAKESGKSIQDAVNYSTKVSSIYGALSAVPIGELIGQLQKTMPQAIPWVVKKSSQMLMNGTVLTSMNEFGDKMKAEVASSSDIPYQYKPTLQRFFTSFALGAALGAVGKAEGKTAETKSETVEAPQSTIEASGKKPTIGEQHPPDEPPPPPAAVGVLKPAYHFDTDTYGLKNDKGEFVQTGFTSEAEATKASTEAAKAPEPATEPSTTAAAAGSAAAGNATTATEARSEPSPVAQGEIVTKGDLYKLPRESLEQMREETKLSDHEKLVKALGSEEAAKRFNKLSRQAESMDHARADKASKALGEIEDKLTPEQQKLIYGIGETGATKEDFDELIKAHSDITFTPHDDIKDIGYIGTLGIRKILPEEILSVKEGKASVLAQAALIRFKGAFDELKNRGLDSENILKAMAHGMSEKSGMSIGDATDFVRDFANAVKERSGEKSATELTAAGEQHIIEGAERISDKELAERFMVGGSKADVAQKPANEGLFDVAGRGQNELFHKGGLNRGILSAKREEFPSFDKLMALVDKIAPGASLRVQSLIDGGDTHGSYNFAEKLITLAKTSPDVWHTLPHEAFHAIEHLLTPEERTALLKEAADQGIMEKHDIAKNYSPEDHEREVLAHLFGDYASDKIRNPTPEAKTIMDKIKDVLATIGAKVRELFGNESGRDILNKVFAGEVGKREGESQQDGIAQHKDKGATLGDALKGIRDTLAPSFAGNGAKQTEVEIRGAYGEAKRKQAIAETAMNEFARQANEMTPDDHTDFYNYMEGRSKGAQLKNKQFQGMADTIRGVYKQYKDILQAMPETRMMSFVQDYFTHQWAKGQDEKIQEFMNNWWQQGSSRNLKERKIPTIADGLAYGLKLAEPNPVRAVSRYVGSMSNYIASVNVLRAINNDLGGGYYADGKQPSGYTALVGRNAERIENARVDEESGKLVPARSLHLYAPKEVADLYNAFYSKGFEDTKLGSAYMVARNAINANTMLELGLSAYHFSTINMQSINQDMSRIVRNAWSRDWTGVGQAIKGVVTPALHFMQGSKLIEQYKDLADHGVDMERIANLFARSNLRIGLDPLSDVSSHGGFYKAWQRGELPELVDKLKSQLTDDYGLGAVKTAAETVGRVVSDVSQPLFNTYVPAIKMSAFHDLMGDWLRQNPGASDAEIAAHSIRIGDMVEDRFGEMNMENIFWNKKAKELLGLTFRAPGWDIGLVRQVGGAAADIYGMAKDAAQGKKFDVSKLDRPLFMVGSVMTYVAMNAAMTYIKTGLMPSDQKLKDLIAYATGGLHKAFGMHPERGELPGHGRELIQMAPIPGEGPLSGVTQEISNKVATLPKKLYETANNTDWNGKPIYDPKSNSWLKKTPGVAQVAHIASGFKPFFMEQLMDGKPEGSNLSFVERFMGVRAAGAKIVAPEKLKEYNEKRR